MEKLDLIGLTNISLAFYANKCHDQLIWLQK